MKKIKPTLVEIFIIIAFMALISYAIFIIFGLYELGLPQILTPSGTSLIFFL